MPAASLKSVRWHLSSFEFWAWNMSKKQILIVIFGTTALLLVVVLMVAWPMAMSVDAATGSETQEFPVEDTGSNSGLSGGNDCYCSPQSEAPSQDNSTQVTE